MKRSDLTKLLEGLTPHPWAMRKCDCGHPSCEQYFINITGSDGRLIKADAELIVKAPEILKELIETKDVLTELFDALMAYFPEEDYLLFLNTIEQQYSRTRPDIIADIKRLRAKRNEIH